MRQEVKEEVDEHVLARQQADAMRKIYEKDRQRKHQQVSSYSDNVSQRVDLSWFLSWKKFRLPFSSTKKF